MTLWTHSLASALEQVEQQEARVARASAAGSVWGWKDTEGQRPWGNLSLLPSQEPPGHNPLRTSRHRPQRPVQLSTKSHQYHLPHHPAMETGGFIDADGGMKGPQEPRGGGGLSQSAGA